jgi:uncharacterized protein YjeT (DUF2065 family)
MTGIGGVTGNVGGGVVLAGASWRWLFAAAVPVALILAALAGRTAPVSPRHDRRLDPLGAVLLGLSASGPATPYAVYAAWLVVTGTGVMLAVPVLSAAITGSLPPAQAGVGAGLQATTREFGSALGVAVIGTVLTARFTAALPAGIRAGHDPRTVAQALAAAAPGRGREVITAFVSGADAGLRVIGISVLVLGALVVLQSLLSRRSA